MSKLIANMGVTAKINGKAITVFLDTGSDCNIISEEAVDKYGLRSQLLLLPRPINLISGFTTSIGYVSFKLQLGSYQTIALAHVVKDSILDLLIGFRTQANAGLILDIGKGQMFIKHGDGNMELLQKGALPSEFQSDCMSPSQLGQQGASLTPSCVTPRRSPRHQHMIPTPLEPRLASSSSTVSKVISPRRPSAGRGSLPGLRSFIQDNSWLHDGASPHST